MYHYEFSDQKILILAFQVSSQELELKIKDYEVIYSRIKDATGVSSIDEAVSRFESQGETSRHLQNLKLENENKIAQLKVSNRGILISLLSS